MNKKTCENFTNEDNFNNTFLLKFFPFAAAMSELMQI